MKKIFSFWIQTNSRIEQTLFLIKQLSKFSEYGDIYLSDSGGRTEEFFVKQFKKNNIFIDNLNYVNNHKFCNDPFEHCWTIFASSKNNMFLFHDDDQIHHDNFKNILEFLINNNEIEYLCSTNHGKSKYITDFKKKDTQKRIDNIIKLYFLSPNNNCLLLTGLYVKNPNTLRRDAKDFIRNSMYGDVSLMCYMFSRNNSHITSHRYIEHIEHPNNHNKTRLLKDRESLSKFISDQNGFMNKIISKLIFINYPKKTWTFLHGLAMSLFYPPIWVDLLSKFFLKFKKNFK